jgi:oligosaccharide repeat unit polymerase
VILIVFYLKSGQQPTNIQLKKIINIGIIILILFVTYLFILSIGWQSIGLGNANLWEYFYKQFLNYVVSGPIILDNWLTQGGARPDWTLLIVFMNFLNVIMGNPERINAVPFVSTGFYETLPGYNSNVGTSFGVYYLIGGFWFTIVMTLLISILSHYLFFKSTMSKNPIVLFLNSLFLTLGSLSFFVQYFTSLTFYELPILFIIFISLFKLGNKIKVDIKI